MSTRVVRKIASIAANVATSTSSGSNIGIPVLPKYLQSITDEQVVLRNYAGELFVYPQVKTKPKRKPRPAVAPCYSFDGAPPMP